MTLDQLLARIDDLRSDTHHRIGAPATPRAIAAAEKRLGAELPADLAAVYRTCDGFALFLGSDPIALEGARFRLLTLEELQTWAEMTGGEDDADGWCRPKRKRSAAWASDPKRITVFDLANGDYLSFTARSGGPPLWIDDYHEAPSVLAASSVEEILERALDPACIVAGTWTSPFVAAETDEEDEDLDVSAQYVASPAHFRAEVELRDGKPERALEIAKAGRKGDKDFRALCDVLVAEALAKLDRREELAKEVAAITKRWTGGKARPLIHPGLWQRLERTVAARLPRDQTLRAIRASRAEAERGDFI